MKFIRHYFIFVALPILICLSVGAVGGWATATSVTTWYPNLSQPAFTPPAYVFGPVWTTLYILMGISWGMTWQVKHPLKKRAQYLFVSQLILNGAWSFIFFSFHLLLWALVDLVLILVLLSWTMATFWKIRPLSAYLLVPYWLWGIFAFAISVGVVYLN